MASTFSISSFYKTGLFALLTALILLGCGGGGSSTPGTGSVAILLTDGPSADFDEINLTIKEIRLLGGDQQVVIFEGEETLDLLELKNHADLFALKHGIPEGSYEKIRLTLSDVALIKKDKDGNITEEHHPQLPGNGKLDLNPRGSFYVSADETTSIQVDIDADKAIHIKQTGNGKYQFRPVVFVDIVDHLQSGKLIRHTGKVYSIDTVNNSFVMCKTVIASSAETKADDCVQVNVNTAALFNNEGDAVTITDLMINDPVIVYGKIAENITNDPVTIAEDASIDDDSVGIDLTLDAIMVAIGTADDFMKIGGVVAVDYDATSKAFDMMVDPNQGFTTDSVLTVILDDSTPVITKNGDALDPSILMAGTAVQSKGVMMVGNGSVLKSVLIIADLAESSDAISGPIAFINDDFSSINVDTSLGEVCVDISSDAHLYQIIGKNSDEILASQLVLNTPVEVYGEMGSTCINADNILVFP